MADREIQGRFADADDETEDDLELADADADDDGELLDIGDLDLPTPDLDTAEALELLATGTIEIVGRLLASTNNALLCRVQSGELAAACVYKPIAGERPLADFPDGSLARREVAAFAVSEATGWGLVPATVLRDGPFGEGMVQRWIAVDPTVSPVDLVVGTDPRLRRMAVFDAAINNTDRKAGHLLPIPGGHIYGVDHGVCFSAWPKLRTVLWAWRSTPFAPDEVAVLERLRDAMDGHLGTVLGALLLPHEVVATRGRIDRLLATGVFPEPDPGRPALPWPPV